MVSAIDFNAVRLAAAMLFILTSAAVWVVLYRQHDRTSVALWALGGMAFGTAMLSRADGNLQVHSAEFVVSGIAAICGAVFRAVALRRDLGLATQAAWVAALFALVSAVVVALANWGHPSFALLFFRGVGAVLLGLSAWYAWQLARRAPSRNGQLLAALMALATLSYLLLCVNLLAHWEAALVVDRWDYLVASVIAVVNGAYVSKASLV